MLKYKRAGTNIPPSAPEMGKNGMKVAYKKGGKLVFKKKGAATADKNAQPQKNDAYSQFQGREKKK